ncbi:MAG: M20/M25/M40 family metallo-hydrolase, partial [Bdellovibrionales bacterium]|nr:M20/M25/M40 family metallo-hydrolase [Bdellovibrionales bacterium]
MNIIEKLQKLVQIPSVSYNEEEVARWIFDYLKGKGIETEMRGWNTQCRIPGRDSSRAVIFNGHTDTVAAGELSLWKHPPSGPGAGVVEDGKLYGLGSSDMKAALAAFMEVAEKYHDTVPPVDLFFCFVTEEEVSGRGSDEYVQYFSSEWHGKYDDVICIVGEPTSFQYIELGNRGVRHFELNVEGVACHAAQAAGKTTNAPEIAVEAIKRVDALKADWLMRFQHEKLGLPAVTLTAMNSSESSSNAVPSHVRLLWDIRTTPDLHDKVELLLKE